MTTLWKLTDQQWRTRAGWYNETKWGPGVTHTASGKGYLCGPGWIHAYTSPELAALLNPSHAGIEDPVLWRAEGEVGKSDHGLKVGTKSLTTIENVPLPEVTTEQRVKFGILCALQVCKEPKFITWAEGWLSGDWSEAAAAAAEAAARAVWVAAEAAEAAQAAAAEAAAAEAEAAQAAAWAARAARAAARAAVWAAEAAAAPIDLQAIAEEALR